MLEGHQRPGLLGEKPVRLGSGISSGLKKEYELISTTGQRRGGERMHIDEYIEKAKRELDAMRELFLANHKESPDMWPLEMAEGEWVENELSERFS